MFTAVPPLPLAGEGWGEGGAAIGFKPITNFTSTVVFPINDSLFPIPHSPLNHFNNERSIQAVFSWDSTRCVARSAVG